jgi:hypothetical protein
VKRRRKKILLARSLLEHHPELSKSSLARSLGIARSTLYIKNSKQAEKDKTYLQQIMAVQAEHPHYGHRRISIELAIRRLSLHRAYRNHKHVRVRTSVSSTERPCGVFRQTTTYAQETDEVSGEQSHFPTSPTSRRGSQCSYTSDGHRCIGDFASNAAPVTAKTRFPRNYRVTNFVDSVSDPRTLNKSVFASAMQTNTAPNVQTMVAPVGKSK